MATPPQTYFPTGPPTSPAFDCRFQPSTPTRGEWQLLGLEGDGGTQWGGGQLERAAPSPLSPVTQGWGEGCWKVGSCGVQA